MAATCMVMLGRVRCAAGARATDGQARRVRSTIPGEKPRPHAGTALARVEVGRACAARMRSSRPSYLDLRRTKLRPTIPAPSKARVVGSGAAAAVSPRQ